MAATYSIPALSLLDQLLLPISTRVVHPTLLPISLLTLIHATRVSHGATQVQGGASRLPLLQSIVLVWILLFGGFTLLRVALAQPIPLFDPGVQWTAFVYGGVHAFSQISGVSNMLSNIAASPERGIYLDLFFSLVDSICRMEGIAKLGIEPVRHNASWLTPLLTSVMIGGGGPLLIGLLNLGSPQWRLQAPAWLTDPTGLMAVDIWSSAVVGGTYWLLSHPRDQGVTMLDTRQAQLAGSVLLFSLLAGTRLKRHFLSSSVSTSKEGEKASNGDAAKQPKQRSRISSRQLLYFAMALPAVLLGLQAILAGDNFGSNGRDIIADPSLTAFLSNLNCFTDLRLQTPSQVLFLLAHPDDEVMFFSPILHSLISSPTTIWAACLSIGQSSPSPLMQADTSALPLRIQELVNAYSHFSIDESRIIWIDDPALQDGMQQVWDPQRVVDVVNNLASNTTEPFHPDWIITFDEYGISGHANHKALAQAAALLSRELATADRAPAVVYRLATLPLPLKYAGLPYALWQRLVSFLSPASSSKRACLTALSSPEQYLTSLKAMRLGHKSQMKWFRWLWWIASSYVYGAEICPDE